MTSILVIPDCQVKDGVDTSYLDWVGSYMLDKRPDVVVNIGDFADMPSLSSYDKGKKCFEGRRYKIDVEAAKLGMARLLAPIVTHNVKCVDKVYMDTLRNARKKLPKIYNPRMVLTLGNHEDRIDRAIQYDAILEGTISIDDLQYKEFGWEVYGYREIVAIEGILFSHYFYNPFSGHPYGGTVENILKNVGKPFVQGHKQGLHIATLAGRRHFGIIAGSCYLHDEEYKGPQANNHWRGIVYLHNVKDGECDPMFISLAYLKKRYENANN